MSYKIGIITQARFGSSRLRGKVLLDVNGMSFLEIHLKRLKRSKLATEFIVATTQEAEAALIEEVAIRNGFFTFRGSEYDVLDRYYNAARVKGLDVVVRVTSDCPLNDGVLIDEIIEFFLREGVSYVSNVDPPTFPDGMDVEVFKFDALELSWNKTTNLKDREHVTPFIRSNKSLFSQSNFFNSVDYSPIRLTLDTPLDKELLERVIIDNGINLNWSDYACYLINNPEVMKINSQNKRNEGF